ncbi:sialidase family protein [Corynebacterium freiburgense]|uniref:sialidase family protein n=1 Tax=Corynebacterium freiburgense TaxID=556548 RepID=UPI000410E513|nr:sialidase family protein [Corynebacterium freiburgense]WJZ03936.1 Sialidase precursor [Corynebacterium freiburgense]
MPELHLAEDSEFLCPRDVDTLVHGVIEVRAPAITQIGGELLVACDARIAPIESDWEAIGGAMAADLPNPNSLILVKNGTPKLLRQGKAEPQRGFSDPSFLTDGERLVLFHARSADVGFFGSTPWTSNTDRDTLHVEIGISDDLGTTWKFQTITGDVSAEYPAVFATSGHGIVAGDLWLQPAVVRAANGETQHITWRSEDRGETWKPGAACGHDCDESCIELWDEKLMLSARSTAAFQSGALGRWYAESTNGGITWSDVQWHETPPAAACNASFLKTPLGLILVYAEAGRMGGSIDLRTDHGWETLVKLGTGQPFGYSDALWFDNALHVVYESEGSLRKACFVTDK